MTSGDVLLSSFMTFTSDSSCSYLDDGTTQFHRSSVSCSKVCQLRSLILSKCVSEFVLLLIKITVSLIVKSTFDKTEIYPSLVRVALL